MNTYDEFIQLHKAQLELSGIPTIYWPTLYIKLSKEIFDAGLVFQIAKIDYTDSVKTAQDPGFKLFVAAEEGLVCDDPNNIFLIDHAWMYDVNFAHQLSEIPALLDRLCNLMSYDGPDDKSTKVEFALREMWRYNQFYSSNKGTIEERLPLWYIMDEVGSAINHSDDPNFRTVPFLYLNQNTTYSLLFPVKNVEFNDEVTRDFVENQTNDPEKRRALLLPWIDQDFTDKSFTQVEPDVQYFLSGRVPESLPQENGSANGRNGDIKPVKLKVYTQYDIVSQYLTDPAFELVDNEHEADVLWLMVHFKDYKTLSQESPHTFVNQFPYEHILTNKDLLSIVCRRKAADKLYDPETLDTYPSWLPTTYNLSTELIEFVSYFQNREARDLDNHWICKPWNLARGLDTHVTNNLFHILRLPSTGPKIAQKYISSPVLYTRPGVGSVKFDVRYVFLLKSVKPLMVYAYSNFFLRFANKEFALNNLHDYEQHFTVMNYSEEAELYHVKCADFEVEWNKMYPENKWKNSVEIKIFKMIKEAFEAASDAPMGKGIVDNPQSRALYAVDLMLEWKNNEMNPVLLEVNFSPDNKRACEYYPDFYNNVFKFLFLDTGDTNEFIEL
ncbi:tubulin--tyrosine ligase-like protein 12 isoform X1 [Cotesia glomerata]|uniref:tubulin--tyrosine ligase-like protein 12 isoform X1 n=1 Tax=Cotesia glomerata TaxID=32391 RepID=UPI001D00BE0F|nr:tubulin--tyrosine ligase-like protein 12 isoform X1 [Cotesia glomerata]